MIGSLIVQQHGTIVDNGASQSLARRRFRALIRLPEPRLNLAEAALCIAWEDQDLDPTAEPLAKLDELAYQVQPRLLGITDPGEQIAALNSLLFDELHFVGNVSNYNDPANSFLDQVLETRTGLPITLAVVYLEVAWRLGWPLVGLALPGHFLVRYPSFDGDFVIDPFRRGRLWSSDECANHVAQYYGSASTVLMERVMQAPTKHEILERMLRNLKSVYLERSLYARALAVVERLVLLEPGEASELRDRGLLRARIGQLHGALEDLDRYARLRPEAAELETLRQHARAIAAELMTGN